MKFNDPPSVITSLSFRKRSGLLILAFTLLEVLYFLPATIGWHSVPFHLFSSKFTGVDYHRDLPVDLAHMPGNDATAVLMDYPNEYYTVSSIRSGHVPWWNPYIGMGRAWIGNAQVHPFSPLLIPMYIHPSTWTYTLQFVLGSLVCLIFAYLFFRILGLSLLPSIVGASLWTWNPYTLHSYIMSSVWAYWWMPLAMVGFTMAIKEKRHFGWLIASVALSLMILCGQPETALILGEMAGIYLLISILPFGTKRVTFKFLTGGLSILLVATLILSASQWYPILKVLGGSVWYKGHVGDSVSNLTHSPLSFFNPSSMVFLQPVLWGALVLLMAAKRKREAIAFTAMLVFALCFSFPSVFNSFPFRLLRLNGIVPALHGAELACVPMAAIVAIGFHSIIHYKDEISTQFKLGSLFLAGCLTVLGFYLLKDQIQWQVAIWLGVSLLCFSAAILKLKSDKIFYSAIAVMVILFPLASQRFYYPYFSSCPQPYWNRGSSATDEPSPYPRFWAQSSPKTGAPYFTPNLNLLSGMSDIRSSSVLNPPGSYLFSRAWGSAGYISHLIYSFKSADAQLLRFLGVNRAVMARTDEKSPFYIVALKPGPRAFFTENIEKYDDEKKGMERFEEVLSENMEYKVALVEDGDQYLQSERSTLVNARRESSGKIKWLRNEQDHLEISVETKSNGMLVILDSYSPTWKASVDGVEVPVLRTDIMFRGIELSSGKHTVEMHYKTGGMMISVLVSLAGWVFLVLWCGIAYYRKWAISDRRPFSPYPGE